MNNSKIGDIKRGGTLQYNRVLLGFCYLLPLMDTFNGMLIKSYSVSGLGIMYRLAFLAFLLYGFIRCKISRQLCVSLIMFGAYILLQYFVSGGYGFASVELTVKLFTPILMVQTLTREYKKGKIINSDVHKLFDWLSIVFPLTLIIPHALNIGYTTYLQTGYKAFYYATNEITFAMCTMIMYNYHRLMIKVEYRHLMRFIICVISGILIGTKISLGVSLFFIVVLVSKSLFNRKNSLKRLVLPVMVMITAIFVLRRFSGQVQMIVNRWLYHQAHAENNISFFFSGRNLYLSNGYALFRKMGWFTQLFGWGLGGANNGMVNIEMDLFDLLFSCGYIGLLLLIILYIQIIKGLKIKTYTGLLFIIISFASSAMGGHVLFTGLGGMSLALLFFYLSIMEPISEKKLFRTKEATAISSTTMRSEAL